MRAAGPLVGLRLGGELGEALFVDLHAEAGAGRQADVTLCVELPVHLQKFARIEASVVGIKFVNQKKKTS